MTSSRGILAVLSLVSIAACGSKDADKSAPAKTADPPPTAAVEPTPAPAAPAAGGWLALAPLPLQLQAPEGSSATDQSEGTIKAVGVTAGSAMLTVGVVPPDMKLTFDQLVTSGNAGGSKVSIKEKLADGFHVESTSGSGLVQIEVRRTIGGLEYSCGTLAPDAETSAIVRAACLSLKAK